MNSLLGKKIDQTQGFLEDGTRVPLSIISVAGNVVTQIKTEEKEGYNSIQVGFGENKRPTKAIAGHIKRAGLTNSPRFFREIRADEAPDAEVGTVLKVAEIFEPGDIVDVSGVSKGKGYAGVIKRHHFHGGPKTHGQSDRERAPGASGQGTTPGRVYKGKKMAGNMGNDNVTVKNLLVLAINGDTILVKGLIPGVRGGMVNVKKVGTKKKFSPLFSQKEKVEEEVVTEEKAGTEAAEEVAASKDEELKTSEVKTAEEAVVTAEEKVETKEDVKTAEETVVDSNESVKAESAEEATEESKEADVTAGAANEEEGEAKDAK